MSALTNSVSSAAGRYAASMIGHQLPTERQRLHLLEQMLDPDTVRILDQRGIQPSWRCLELGAGTGSIARWLACRCPNGHVVATDSDPGFLADLSAPNCQVLRHDVVAEDFPAGSFDLIHARWLLANLPEREQVLAKVVTWLAPGGWLVIEDPDRTPADSSPHPLLRRFGDAVAQLVAESHGADLRWARRRLPGALAEVGLVELGLSVSVKTVGDGGVGDAAYRMTMAQAHPGLVGRGLLSEADYQAGMALLNEPSVIDAPFANFAAWGRREISNAVTIPTIAAM
jgi:SAM-dependent methyltransferase